MYQVGDRVKATTTGGYNYVKVGMAGTVQEVTDTESEHSELRYVNEVLFDDLPEADFYPMFDHEIEPE